MKQRIWETARCEGEIVERDRRVKEERRKLGMELEKEWRKKGER